MKLFLLFAFCIVIVASKKIRQEHLKQWSEIIKNVEDMCIKEHKTDKMIIKEMLEELKYPEDKSLKCYWQCLQQKLGVLKLDGDIDLDVVLKKVTFIPKEIAMKCTENSKNEKDKCEKAYKMTKCVMDDIAV